MQQNMVSLSRLSFFLFLVVCSFLLLLPEVVQSTVIEDEIFNEINKYREGKNLSKLIQNNNAGCLADKLASELENEPCSNADDFSVLIGKDSKFSNFHDILKKCHVDYNTTIDGIVLPVCVPKMEPKSVLNNFTGSHYVRYLNDSNYTGAGVGTQADWVVVVLSTNTTTGNFTSNASLVAQFGILHCTMLLFLGLFVSVL